MEVLNNIINFALIKSKTVRQPLRLTRPFDFVRIIFALIKSKTVRQSLGLTRTFDFVRIYLHSSIKHFIMARGKKTCKILKEIRRQIAEANDIEYVVEECQYKGDCLGTCPKCEAEVRYLEQQLHQRQMLGKAVMVAGISAGLLSLSSCGNEMYDQINTSEEAEIIRGGKEPAANILGEIVEQMPSYPGGTSALMKFLTENIEYPEQMIKDSIQGRVICSFIVGRDGAISDIKVVRSLHPLLDKEAVRVLSLMPKWIPGKQNGQPSKVKYILPITFRLQNASDSITVKKE